MENFPTLSVKPSTEGWSEQKAFDPTIRVRSEAGYVKTRARCTRIPKKYRVSYVPLPLADKLLVEAFEDFMRVGADAFKWRYPVDSQWKTVRFAEPVQYAMMGTMNLWKVDMVLEEV
ncbi:MAG: hypothetical protein HPY84_11790 [Syntrophobacteraceae bacterium]|mgnify:CR=1 FL=1|jgi:hypothetical protein|nr:hypothetical protein [Syntrophobacteraceae bacterium]